MNTSFVGPPGPCEGFDKYSGKLWIYPDNMAIRQYQYQAVKMSLFTNAMIVLPTGFGKTFIAAVVMYNFYRWYPEGKIIFVAPTKPLVAQQVQECRKISGIPASDCIEMTGTMSKQKRVVQWSNKRVFFATPQVIDNDLEDSTLPARDIRCLVIDEAHKAQGGYAYVNIVRQLQDLNKDGFRILALSATPGSDIQRVQQVITNLYIGDVMFRSEGALDLMQFKNTKSANAWTLALTGKHQEMVTKYIEATRPMFKTLYTAGIIYSDCVDKVAKYTLIKGMDTIKQNSSGKEKGRLGFLCTAAVSLSQNFELLTLYGIRVFYASVMSKLNEPRSLLRTVMAGKVEFDVILEDIRNMFGDHLDIAINNKSSIDLLKGHPKLAACKDILIKHFQENAEKTETRAIVFTKYRDSVYDIVQTLQAYDPIIKPTPFVGQGDVKKTGTGMKQSEQILTIRDFKAGKYNVLVATCVAEEGLDIGEVDLIVCYDTSSSPISTTQRRGRTGRKRSGNVQTLLTQGYEEKKLKRAGNSRRQVEEQLYQRANYIPYRYKDAPRMIPAGIDPTCLKQKIYPINDVDEEEERPKRKRQKKDTISVEVDDEKKCKEGKQCKDVDLNSSSERVLSIEREIEREMELAKRKRSEVQVISDEETSSTIQFSDDDQDDQVRPEKVVQLEDPGKEGSGSCAGKDGDLDDLDWGSDIDYNCV